MPLLLIRTNQSLSQEQARRLLRDASALCAEVLGKSEAYVMTTLETDRTMLFAGSDDPCAYLELKSLGLTPERTPELSAALGWTRSWPPCPAPLDRPCPATPRPFAASSNGISTAERQTTGPFPHPGASWTRTACRAWIRPA